MNAEQGIWHSVLPILKANIDIATATYNTFIATLSPIAIFRDEFILETPQEGNRIYLQQYISHIERALLKATGRKWRVTFSLPSERDQYIQVESYQPPITLNPRNTFDTFVIGSSNRFAHAASNAVANNPGRSYNPLFIYGGVGLGKTHLMHAIGNEIQYNNPQSRIMYVTSEKFTNELIAAIRNDRNEEFRSRYRTVDVLMIDDIQFIANKESTQEEFFHTFNTLFEMQKQIVISSDKQPKEVPSLEERLRSRFEWGLIADIQPPDLETRVAILQKKAELENLDISLEVMHFIATKVESNIRELEGSLTRVIAFSSLTGKPLCVESADEALKDFYPPNSKRTIDAKIIQEIVAEMYNLKVAELTGPKRSREIAFPRQIAMYLTRELTGMSLPKIGDAFGGRDHTTAIHACEKITNAIREDVSTKNTIEDLIKRIKE